MATTVLLPGDEFPRSSTQQNKKLGDGLHILNGRPISSVAGIPSAASGNTDAATMSRPIAPSSQSQSPKLPYITAIILARVTRITTRQAHVAILAVDDVPCVVGPGAAEDAAFAGMIRQQDIRATEKDKVLVAESFAVGDVVRAEVISLGDERNYYLSTARNELGVVMAKDVDTGGVMLPVSWREVVDRETGRRALRKVARPEM